MIQPDNATVRPQLSRSPAGPGKTRTQSVLSKMLPHTPFYATAIILTLLMALVYLLNNSSGGPWAWIGLPLDDNWIHLVYARSLAEQGWFFYNPGIPEAGMSSPLWVIILAVAYKIFTPLGVTPQWIAKGGGLFFALAVPIAAYHLALRIGVRRRWAWAVGILVMIEPNLAYGNVAGMEFPMFTFLTLLAILLCLRESYLACGITLGMLVITRGEGVPIALLIGALPFLVLYLKRKNFTIMTRDEFKLGLKLFLPALIMGGAWALYNHSTGVSFLPNTYIVKHNFALGYFNLENLVNFTTGYVAHLAWFEGGTWIITLLGVTVAGIRLYKDRAYAPLLLLLAIPIVSVYLFSINMKFGPEGILWTYASRRYMDFLLPVIILLFVTGVEYVWRRLHDISNRWVVLVAPPALIGIIGFLVYNIAIRNIAFAQLYSWDTENIEQVSVKMGKWVGDTLPLNAKIAVTDAGAVRFFARSDQVIVDFMGLNCRQCVGRPFPELANEIKPDYLVFFRQGLNDSFTYEEMYALKPDRVTILGGGELVAVKLLSLPPWPPE